MNTANAHQFGFALGFGRSWMNEDMWRVGCAVASNVFRMPCLRLMTCKKGTLRRFLGSCSFYSYLEKYNVLGLSMRKQTSGKLSCSTGNRSSLMGRNAEQGATPDAVDFISKLVKYDHQQRLSAEEALKHPFILSAPKGL